ncbi:Ubiquitin domain [Trinorchestia longiramus]|nr:Ubiquitin domain [Trinorchestia longiramus]
MPTPPDAAYIMCSHTTSFFERTSFGKKEVKVPHPVLESATTPPGSTTFSVAQRMRPLDCVITIQDIVASDFTKTNLSLPRSPSKLPLHAWSDRRGQTEPSLTEKSPEHEKRILGWLKSFLSQVLSLFGLRGSDSIASSEVASQMLSIFVRTNTGERVQVQLAREWTVAQLKIQLEPQLGTSRDHIKLIFAGKELPEDLVLGQCDLGQNSVLHAVLLVTSALPSSSAACVSDVTSLVQDATIEEPPFTKRPGQLCSSSEEGVKESQCTVSIHEGSENGAENLSSGQSSSLDASEPFTLLEPPEDAAAAVDDGADVEAARGVAFAEQQECQRLLCDASTVITIQLSQHEQEQLKLLKESSGITGGGERPHFYVYCVQPCGGVKVGKLRVRCSCCKQGAVTLRDDPTCWRDVLVPKQIICWCETPACKDEVKECYAEFYFKCGGHVTSGEGDVAVPLHMIRANLPGVVCLSCAEVASPVIVFECEASHVLCLDCFITYCLSKLSERQFTHDPEYGYTLPCPANCFDSLIKEVHHFRLLGEDQYRRYQHWATEEAVLAAGGVLCPRPGCGHGLIPDSDCVRITCVGGCGYVFCRLCLQEYHTGECWQLEQGQPSSLLARSASSASLTAGFSVNTRGGIARWDVASAAAIQSLTKPCPQCRTPTERSGGCMHMVCTRASCRFNWCWVCHGEWTRDCMAAHWFG